MAYDTTPFQSTTSMAELADAIRNKAYGKDVREPIAQGFEQFDTVKGTVFVRLEAVEKLARGYEARIKQLESDLKNEIEDNNTEMQNKINHILLGVDEPSIRLVVNSILDERLGKEN